MCHGLKTGAEPYYYSLEAARAYLGLASNEGEDRGLLDALRQKYPPAAD